MDKLNSLDLSISNSIDIASFISSMIGAWILCYVVSLHYENISLIFQVSIYG